MRSQEISTLPKPQARGTTSLQQNAEKRHEIARKIGSAMGVSCYLWKWS